MKINSKKLIVLLSIILVLLILSVVGYTYAKYRTQVKGGAQADIAKWSFTVNENSEEIETIKLQDTISKAVDEKFLKKGKIAPGTTGKFIIDIDATGTEVGLNYDVKFANEHNKPTNLKFTYGGQTYNTLAELQEATKGTIYVNDTNKTKNLEIGWVWEYETGTEETQKNNNDTTDTNEGIVDLNYTFDIVVTGTQIEF